MSSRFSGFNSHSIVYFNVKLNFYDGVAFFYFETIVGDNLAPLVFALDNLDLEAFFCMF